MGFLCLYLITAGRSPPFGDAAPMWEAAQNLVRHGTFAIDIRWPVNAPPGRGGHYYPVAALLACLVHVPGALLHRVLSAAAPARADQLVAVTSQLGPLVAGAVVPTLFFRLLKQVGYDRRQAAWATLLLGGATSIWVYAHRPYSEVLQAACFLWFLGALLRVGDAPSRRASVHLGLALGMLVNTKNVYLACLPGAAVYLFWRLRQRHRTPTALSRVFTWTCGGVLPGLIALAWYNYVRWGSFTNSGYGAVTAGFWGEHLLVGLWGQFLSPGKSVFLYAPPLLLSLFGLRRLWLRRPHVAVAITLVVAPIVLLCSRYLFWSGDWGWGPRYLVFALAPLLVPAAEIFARHDEPPESTPRSRPRRLLGASGVAAVFAAGLMVQCLGNAFYWDDFINISRQAQRGWLGRPDTGGTVMAPYPCFSCFEEVYPIDWLPPMQPIAGHWWLLRHKLAGHDWRTAAATAPWRRYTTLDLDISDSYQPVEIDWWPFGADPESRLPAILVATCLLLAIPARPWVRALRSPAAGVPAIGSVVPPELPPPEPPAPRA